MAPWLQPSRRVVPTVHDVRGAPVPGLSGIVPHRAAPAVRFRDVLGAVPSFARVSAPRVSAPKSIGGARQALTASIRRAAGTAGVDPALSVAVARAESDLDPSARSSDGLSVGTFQMTQVTAGEMRRKIAARTVTRPAGPDDVALGVGYLRYLHDLFGRRARLTPGLSTTPVADAGERRRFAVAAYNAGEGRVARAQARAAASGGDPTRFADVRRFLPVITQTYVQRVIAYAAGESAARVAS